MIQEEKQLLLQDLCARLPYGVKCYVPVENCTMELTGKRLNYFCFHKDVWGIDYSHEQEIVIDPLNDANNNYIVKPYLRPLDSITEEEEKGFNQIFELELKALEDTTIGHSIESAASSVFMIDFYNKNHFDYRGLIGKGLAIEAPEGMYE